jgi:imidazolonepropionase-like amidohydrolase
MLTAAHAHGDEGHASHTWRHKTIEHGTFMSEETMELMKSMMRIWSLRLLPVRSRKMQINGFYPEIVVPSQRSRSATKATFAKA